MSTPQPSSLRVDEDVIEEFSVSRKYTNILIVLGIIAIGLSIATMMFDDPILDSLAAGGGPLGPVLFLFVEIALAVVGIYLIGMGIFFQVGFDFFLTNQRVIESVGFFSRRELSTDYNQINDLIVRQDFINKLFLKTGTLGITTPGTAGEEFKLINIDNPLGRRDLLRQLIRADIDGRTINRDLVADAKVMVGMAASKEEALATLNGHGDERDRVTPAPLPESVSSSTPPDEAPTVASPVDEVSSVSPVANTSTIEDLRGDGIDESDRLRAAQKNIQMPDNE